MVDCLASARNCAQRASRGTQKMFSERMATALDPNTIKSLKDRLLRLSLEIEMHEDQE